MFTMTHVALCLMKAFFNIQHYGKQNYNHCISRESQIKPKMMEFLLKVLASSLLADGDALSSALCNVSFQSASEKALSQGVAPTKLRGENNPFQLFLWINLIKIQDFKFLQVLLVLKFTLWKQFTVYNYAYSSTKDDDVKLK